MPTLTLNSNKALSLSSRYLNPASDGDILPIVYGAMISGWVAPCIDTLTYIYCIADHAVLSAASGNPFTVYDDNGDRADATFYDATDYEGQGVIAAVQLLSAAQGNLVVSCSGKINSDTGALIQNPIDIIDDLISEVDSDTDSLSFSQAREDADTLGYHAAGVILAEQPYVFWINSIMGSFLGDWWLNHAGVLKVNLATQAISSLQVSGFLVERHATAISGTITLKNIVNQAVIDYQLGFSRNDKRFKEGVQSDYGAHDDGETSKDTFSQAKYGIRKRTFTLDWVQDAAVMQAIQESIVDKFSARTFLIDWTEYDFLNAHVEEGDYIAYSWEERIDENGDPVVNRLAQVLSVSMDLDQELITFQLKDLGLVLTALPDIWDGSVDTGDGGTFGGAADTRRLL